ncbi:MAG: WD40 repeat domain-containing protein [Anaerolineae bacterium]|nr:WD40 repeat domain-containing protein [Anaerolineae bacterium]
MPRNNLFVAFLLSLFWMVCLIGCTQAQAEVAAATAVPTAEPTTTQTSTSTPEPTATATLTLTPTIPATETAVPTPTIPPSPTPSLQNLSASNSQLITVMRTDFAISSQSDPNVYDLAVSPDDRYLAVASNQGLLIYDLATLELITAVNEDGSVKKSVAWSPDGKHLAVGSGPRVWIWNFETMSTEFEFSGHEVEMYHVTWAVDRPLVFSVANNGSFGSWDIELGEPTTPVEEVGMRAIEFSPNGDHVAFSQWYQLSAVNMLNGDQTIFSEEHSDLIAAISWYPGSSFFVSGSYDGTLRIWDLAQQDSMRVLEGHSSDVLDVAWSPNGIYIASGSADLTTLIWSAETGEVVYRLRGHTDGIRSLDWFHDGSRLVTGSLDGTIRIWDIP